MKSEVEIKQNAPAQPTRARKTLREALLTPLVCSVLASTGIFGGVSSLFVGIVAVIIHSVIPKMRNFDRVGTTLLIVAIPMILIGSIFLDEINNNHK